MSVVHKNQRVSVCGNDDDSKRGTVMEFKRGERINLEGGKVAAVKEKLGEGGQGAVYKVEIDGMPFALKWYTCRFKNPKKFRSNLKSNIECGAPDEKFLWPKFLTEERDGSFGYVMDLRPKEFSDFSDILNNKIKFASTEKSVLAALNITNAFRELHRKGLSYQDLNDGNFFVNVENGEVLICDNDNVTPGGMKNPGNIGGKPGYMAPEVFRGDAFPGVLTDNYSLAVILFKLFCRHDPMMGDAFVKSVCITERREMELYGTNPVFIFNPNDTSNRPVPGVHPNPLKLWPRLPNYIRDAFETSFVDGIKNPNARLPDNEWQKKLVRFLDELMLCPICGSEHMIYKFEKGKEMKFGCGHSFSYPRILKSKGFEIALFPGQKIRACHISMKSDDFKKIEGEVIMNKNNPALWGIKNVGDAVWTFIAGGEAKTVGKNSVLPIAANMEIQFNDVAAKIVP